MGTTSACAENTPTPRKYQPKTRNYLRVRGEYAFALGLDPEIAELPPRARRIPSWPLLRFSPLGTTSACAENTLVDELIITGHRNYLRVRGEYNTSSTTPGSGLELPPRARRIPWLANKPMYVLGTTSACAENTKPRLANSNSIRNYLRVRGEYMLLSSQ